MGEFDRAVSAQVFGAVESIRAGNWDDYLHQIAAALDGRQRSDEYRQKILARAEFRAGDTSLFRPLGALDGEADQC